MGAKLAMATAINQIPKILKKWFTSLNTHLLAMKVELEI